MIGEERTIRLAMALMGLCGLLLILLAFGRIIPDLGFWLMLGVLYGIFYLYLLRKQPPMETLFFEGLVDGNFLLIGLISLLWLLWQP